MRSASGGSLCVGGVAGFAPQPPEEAGGLVGDRVHRVEGVDEVLQLGGVQGESEAGRVHLGRLLADLSGGVGHDRTLISTFSTARAIPSSDTSAPRSAANCSPTGQPSAVNPAGTLAAGCPLRLNAQVSAVE